MLSTSSVTRMTEELMKESKRVRSLYEDVPVHDWREGQANIHSIDERLTSSTPAAPAHDQAGSSERAPGQSDHLKSPHELAGGAEDWEDVDNADVDRYGFILRPRMDMTRPHRTSTVLQVVSDAPRQRRPLGGLSSSAGTRTSEQRRPPSKKISARSLRTQGSTNSTHSISRASIRAASHRLPGNADKRWMDEAGDMLTLPPGLADVAKDADNGKAAAALRAKEFARTEKWRRMARTVRTGPNGEGMEFDFDTTSHKLINRTWKGIPDRWRGAAWYAFLATAAKAHPGSASETDIISDFHRLLDIDSSDDVQIDMDVPRTISSHIMFRRRYRGGQRLLFRVLHCLSLYFPDTGYVQGMACLAATLLCYYDEEKCFVMLVRLWTLRGMARLFESGFGGLMHALEDFRTGWMLGRDVDAKLVRLLSLHHGRRRLRLVADT